MREFAEILLFLCACAVVIVGTWGAIAYLIWRFS